MEQVILVDSNDNVLGTMEKMEAHSRGLLHRAFSVLLFNSHGELLLQQRSVKKYHSGGLWTNTCCSHPRPGEKTATAVYRRLKEEMGIITETRALYSFVYTISFDQGLTEHELDHVFVGHYDGDPIINPDEIKDWKWVNLDSLREDIALYPDQYTYWFKLILNHPEIHRYTRNLQKV